MLWEGSGLQPLLQLLQKKATSTSEFPLKCMTGADKMAQLQKMGISRNVVLEGTGGQKWVGLGSITMSCFTPKPIFFSLHCAVSAPPRLWSKSSWASPRSSCSLKQLPSRRYSSCFQHSGFRSLTGLAGSPDVLIVPAW